MGKKRAKGKQEESREIVQAAKAPSAVAASLGLRKSESLSPYFLTESYYRPYLLKILTKTESLIAEAGQALALTAEQKTVDNQIILYNDLFLHAHDCLALWCKFPLEDDSLLRADVFLQTPDVFNRTSHPMLDAGYRSFALLKEMYRALPTQIASTLANDFYMTQYIFNLIALRRRSGADFEEKSFPVYLCASDFGYGLIKVDADPTQMTEDQLSRILYRTPHTLIRYRNKLFRGVREGGIVAASEISSSINTKKIYDDFIAMAKTDYRFICDAPTIRNIGELLGNEMDEHYINISSVILRTAQLALHLEYLLPTNSTIGSEKTKSLNHLLEQIYHSAIQVADLPSAEKQRILTSTQYTKFDNKGKERSRIFYQFFGYLLSKKFRQQYPNNTSRLTEKENIVRRKIQQQIRDCALNLNAKQIKDKNRLEYELFLYALCLPNSLDPYYVTELGYFHAQAIYKRSEFLDPTETAILRQTAGLHDLFSTPSQKELYYSIDYSISSPGVILTSKLPTTSEQGLFVNSYYIIIDTPDRPQVVFYNNLTKAIEEIPTKAHSLQEIKNGLRALLGEKKHIPIMSREELATVIKLTSLEFHLGKVFTSSIYYQKIHDNLYGDGLKRDLENIPPPYNDSVKLQAQIERLRLRILETIANPEYNVKPLKGCLEDLLGKIKNNAMLTTGSIKAALKQSQDTLIIDREYFTITSEGLLQKIVANTRSTLLLDRIYLDSLLLVNYYFLVLITDSLDRYHLQYKDSFEHACTYLTYYVAYLRAMESLGNKVIASTTLFSTKERIVAFEPQPIEYVIQMACSKIKELESEHDIKTTLDFAAKKEQALQHERELLQMLDRQAAIELALHNERAQVRRDIENRNSYARHQETAFPETAPAPVDVPPVLPPSDYSVELLPADIATQLATCKAESLRLGARLSSDYSIELLKEYETYIEEITAIIKEASSIVAADAKQDALRTDLLLLKMNAQISRIELFLFLSQDCEQEIITFVREVTNPRNFRRAMPIDEKLLLIHGRFTSCADHARKSSQAIKLELMTLYRQNNISLEKYTELSSYTSSLVKKRMATLNKCIEESLTLYSQFLADQKAAAIAARKQYLEDRQCSFRKISQLSEPDRLALRDEITPETLIDHDVFQNDEETEVDTGGEPAMATALPVHSHVRSNTTEPAALRCAQAINSKEFIADTPHNAEYLLVEEYISDGAAAGNSTTMHRQLTVYYYDKQAKKQERVATVRSQKAQEKLLKILASHQNGAALSAKDMQIIGDITGHHPRKQNPFDKGYTSPLRKYRSALEADLSQTIARHKAFEDELHQTSQLYHEIDHFDEQASLERRSPTYKKEVKVAEHDTLLARMQASHQHLPTPLAPIGNCFDNRYNAKEHKASKRHAAQSFAVSGDASALPEHVMQTDEIKIFYSLFSSLDKEDLSATLLSATVLGSYLLKPFYNTKSEDLDVACVGDWKKIVNHVKQYPIENLRTQYIGFANCDAIKFTYRGVKFDITCYANHEAFNFSHRRRAFTTHRMGFDLFEKKFTFFHEKALSDFLAKKLRPTSPDIFKVDDRRLFIALFSPLSFSDELVQMISDEYTPERSAELLKVLFLPHFFNKTVSKIFSKDLLQLTKDRLFEIDARRIGKLSDAEIEQTPSHLMAKLFFPEDVLRILTNPSNADWLSTLCSTAKDDRDLLRKLQDLVDYKPICFSHDSGKQPNHPDRKNTVIYCSQLDHGTLRYRVALPGTATVFEGTITEQDLFVMLEGRSYKKMLLIRGSQEFNLFLTSNFTDLSHTLRGAIIATLMERGHLPLLSLLELTMECPELLHTHTAENGARQADATAPLPAAKESAERAARAGPATLFQSVDGTSKQGTDPRLCI